MLKFLLRQKFRQPFLYYLWPKIMPRMVKIRLQKSLCEVDFRSLWSILVHNMNLVLVRIPLINSKMHMYIGKVQLQNRIFNANLTTNCNSKLNQNVGIQDLQLVMCVIECKTILCNVQNFLSLESRPGRV